MIEPGFCQCGCGGRTAIKKQSEPGYKAGDYSRFVIGHHMKARADKTRNCYIAIHDASRKNGYIYEHVLKAEIALGKPLPRGAEVHHVDENKRNNANTNLVICQDSGYHSLLHVRAKTLRAGGNPNTQQLCTWCSTVKDMTEFCKNAFNKRTGRHWVCKDCKNAYQKKLKAARKERQAA